MKPLNKDKYFWTISILFLLIFSSASAFSGTKTNAMALLSTIAAATAASIGPSSWTVSNGTCRCLKNNQAENPQCFLWDSRCFQASNDGSITTFLLPDGNNPPCPSPKEDNNYGSVGAQGMTDQAFGYGMYSITAGFPSGGPCYPYFSMQAGDNPPVGSVSFNWFWSTAKQNYNYGWYIVGGASGFGPGWSALTGEHTYGIYWGANHLSFWLDGQQVGEVSIPTTTIPVNVYVLNRPEYGYKVGSIAEWIVQSVSAP